MKKKLACLLLAVLLALGSGCSMQSVESMYQLPKLPSTYYKLQTSLENILANGAEYTVPAAGQNRQSVQMVDLDGDGAKEAVAIFRTEDEEKPIKIYIFKEMDEVYRIVGLIEEDGGTVDTISFADLDGAGDQEILLGLQAGQGALKVLSVYCMKSGEPESILKREYAVGNYYDIDSDGTLDLVLANFDATTGEAVVDQYVFEKANGMVQVAQVALTLPVQKIERLRAGRLLNDVPALFLTYTTATGDGDKQVVSDILACRYGRLMNITLMGSGVYDHRFTLEDADTPIYGQDLDGDGVFDLPQYRTLERTGEDSFRVLDWYNFSLSGERLLHMTTYHNFSEGWYLEVPEAWSERLLMRRDEAKSGQRSVTFFVSDGAETVDLLTVFIFTGANRTKLAQGENRFIVYDRSETIISAELGAGVPPDLEVSREEILRRLRLIETDWYTGEVG